MCEKDPNKICNCCVIDCETDTEINCRSDLDSNLDASLQNVSSFIKKRDLYNSTPWFDSSIALEQIRKVSISIQQDLIHRKIFHHQLCLTSDQVSVKVCLP